MQERVTRLEEQYKRISSDIESEKRTRANVNKEALDRIRDVSNALEEVKKYVWIGIGIMIAIDSVAVIVVSIVHK